MPRYIIRTIMMTFVLLLAGTRTKAKDPDSVAFKRYADLMEGSQRAGTDSASYYAEKGLLYFIAHGNEEMQAQMILALANVDLQQGRYEQAKIRALYALNIYRRKSNYRAIVSALNFTGIVELALNKTSMAEEYFNAALELHDTIPTDNHGLMLTYMNLGRLYFRNNDLQTTQKYFSLAETASKRIPVSDSVIALYNSIASFYIATGANELALRYLNNSLEASNRPDLLPAYATTLHKLGVFYVETGDARRAVDNWNKALSIARQQNMYPLQLTILLDASGVVKQEYVAEYLDKAMAICAKMHDPITRARLYGQMAMLYERQGQYMNALYAAKKQGKIIDSIDKINREKEFKSKNTIYQLERSNLRVKELQSLTMRNAAQSTIIIIFSISTFVAFMIVIFQYSKVNKLNRRMAQHEKELDNLNNMKNKLFSIIGHDLRAPLAKIYTVLDLYEDGMFDEEERTEILRDLKDHTKATTDTLDKLLYWGKSLIRGDDLKQENFETKKIITQNIELKNSASADKNITITDTTPADNIVYADRSHFDFILRNLLANAIKFTYQDGSIIISCRDEGNNGMVVFSVRDNGKGMNKQQMAKLFEPFHTTDGTDHEKGTGIGLMLCKEFAIKNGGDLWAESEEGKGSTFCFSLKKSRIDL